MVSKNKLDTSEYSQETRVENNAKKLLSEDPRVQDSVVEIKFLAVSWLDDFEKQIFDGKTVNSLLDHRQYD